MRRLMPAFFVLAVAGLVLLLPQLPDRSRRCGPVLPLYYAAREPNGQWAIYTEMDLSDDAVVDALYGTSRPRADLRFMWGTSNEGAFATTARRTWQNIHISPWRGSGVDRRWNDDDARTVRQAFVDWLRATLQQPAPLPGLEQADVSITRPVPIGWWYTTLLAGGALATLAGVCLVTAWLRAVEERWAQRRLLLACGACGYELTGLRGGICPECGTPIPGDSPPSPS